MARFFPKSIDSQVNGSRAELDSQRAQFRSGQLSGFFEIQSMPEELELLLYAGGEEIATYRLWPNSRLKITSSEVGIGWDHQAVPIRAVALPDHASRALWQSLEFPLFSQTEVLGLTGWKKFLDTCRTDRLTGTVEIASRRGDGFLFLYEGLVAPNEFVFCSDEGFTTSLQVGEGFMDCPLQLSIYKADPASQAYQCLLLRRAGAIWGDAILSTYKDMVGQKLLTLLDGNLNALLMHQQANIRLAGLEIIDNHFFCESHATAEAYRLLFQDLSQLTGRVIGGMVTRRVLSNTFDRLGFSEKESLKVHKLTPADLNKL